MTIYHYTAIRRDGRQLVGEMDAASRQTVLETLHKLGHLPVEVGETKARRQGQSAGGICSLTVSVDLRFGSQRVNVIDYMSDAILLALAAAVLGIRAATIHVRNNLDDSLVICESRGDGRVRRGNRRSFFYRRPTTGSHKRLVPLAFVKCS